MKIHALQFWKDGIHYELLYNNGTIEHAVGSDQIIARLGKLNSKESVELANESLFKDHAKLVKYIQAYNQKTK